MAKKGNRTTCKIFWQGASYTMAFPTQLARALEVVKGDKLVIYLDNGRNLVVEKYVEGREYPENALFTSARVIGAGRGKTKMHSQLGFTVPRPLAEQIKKEVYQFPVIEEKVDGYFKIVFKKLEEN